MKIKKNYQGFTLLYSILVTGVVLSIVFAITNITYKQLSLTGTARDSQTAFYMADTGAECVKYWDYKGAFSTANASGKNISCNGKTYTVGGKGFVNTMNSSGVVSTTTQADYVDCPADSVNTKKCALNVVTLKYKPSGAATYQDVVISLYKNKDTRESTVIANGHNIDVYTNPRQVERSVKLVYTPPDTKDGYCAADILVLLDMSSSINDTDDTGTGDSITNFDLLKDSAKNLVKGLFNLPNSDNKIGLITFSTYPKLTNSMRLVNKQGSTTLMNYLNNLTYTGGNTNMQGALQLAYGEFTGHSIAPSGRQDEDASFDDSRDPADSNTCYDGDCYDNRGDNRDDSVYPNYVFILTDGAPNAHIGTSYSNSAKATASLCSSSPYEYKTNINLYREPNIGKNTKCFYYTPGNSGWKTTSSIATVDNTNTLSQTADFATQLKTPNNDPDSTRTDDLPYNGASIYTIGIKYAQAFSDRCKGYGTSANQYADGCSEFQKTKIVGPAYGSTGSTDPNNYYYDAVDFDQSLKSVINTITSKCQ